MGKRNRDRTIYMVLMLACIVGFWLFENFYTPASYSRSDTTGSSLPIPKELAPSSTTGAIVEHDYFTLSYNEPFEQAEWVAYILKKEHLTYDDRERPYFIEDPKVRTHSADWRNYKRSGYDRGHLCPAGDRRFSENAYNETFYTSNISPQHKEFNAGVWNRLELQVRQWAKRYGELLVITGGVLEEDLHEIGIEDVDVPRYYYKIVARGMPNNLEIIAFLMPATESTRPLQDFVVSVDEVEKRTGIDFFEGQSDAWESKMEEELSAREWKF